MAKKQVVFRAFTIKNEELTQFVSSVRFVFEINISAF